MLLILTPEFRIAAANDVYLRATMTERKNIVGKLLFEVFPDNPGDADTAGTRILQDSLKRVLRTRLPDALAVQKYDIRRPDSEGGGFEERYWSIDNSPVVGNDGEVAFIINRAEDVTEYVRLKQHRVEEHQQTVLIRSAPSRWRRKSTAGLRRCRRSICGFATRITRWSCEIAERGLAEQRAVAISAQLEQSNRELEAANDELESFSFSVSHDLRAPLRAIDGFSRILLADYSATLPAEASGYLSDVRAGTQQMGRLIDDLLAFSRLSRQPIKKQVVAPAQSVDGCLRELRGRPEAGRVVVTVGELPVSAPIHRC